jgi:hypothetical protein
MTRDDKHLALQQEGANNSDDIRHREEGKEHSEIAVEQGKVVWSRLRVVEDPLPNTDANNTAARWRSGTAKHAMHERTNNSTQTTSVYQLGGYFRVRRYSNARERKSHPKYFCQIFSKECNIRPQ